MTVLQACILLTSCLAAQSAPPGKLAKSIERVYGAGAQVDTMKIDTSNVYRVSKGGTLLGFAEVRNVIGKELPITFLVAVDPAATLRDVDILVYREPQGGEVAYDSWRKQFRGKTAADPLQVGKDIRNISGATISSNSVTLGVRQAVAQLSAWRTAGKLK
ncbi:MAG TPA: FMN-binding protein [Gemmatimonadales bacterium]|jgi:Na+-translocating ferredoxin:NAD+ oxidoreductase RnfG subunit